jgi:hypothetical protein
VLPISSGDANVDLLGWALSPLPDGGLAISGGFLSSLTLLPDTAEEQSLLPNGTPAFSSFVLFLDETLAFERLLRLGAANEASSYRVVPAEGGGLFVTGDLSPSLTLGQATPVVLQDVDGGNAAFVARLDADDEPVWAVAFGGPGGDYARSVVEASDGSVVVGGYYGLYEANATMSVPGLDGVTLEGNEDADLFVASFAADGTPKWLKGVRSDGGDSVLTMNAFANGDVAVSGFVGGGFQPGDSGDATFSDGEVITLIDVGTFLVRYEGATGARVWTRVASPASSYGATVLADGGVVQCGDGIGGFSVFGAGEPNETVLPGDTIDGVVVKHAP